MGTKISDEATGSDLLVCFRTAYLKAIATAWQDESYKQNLTSGRNVLEWPGFLRYLPGNEPYYESSPKENSASEEFVCTNTERAKKLPWSAHVTLGDNPNGPIFARALTAGWMGCNDRFIIVIPPRPEDPADFPAAIAAYLQQFPTLLGYRTELATQSATNWDFNAGEKGFLSFSNLLALAIPFCWTNMSIADLRRSIGHNPIIDAARIEQESFLSLLTTHRFDQNGLHAITDFGAARGENLLAMYFGFNNSWNFNFWFLDANNLNQELGKEPSQGDHEAKRIARAFTSNKEYHPIHWDSDKKEWCNLFNVIDLHLPRNPIVSAMTPDSANQDQQLVQNIVRANALALYNDSMSHYPFSCP